MKKQVLWCNGQRAIICAENLAILSEQGQGTNGSIALAFEIEQNPKSEEMGLYHIIWQWGGDWTIFDENFFANILDPERMHGAPSDTDYEKEYESAKEEAEMYANAILSAIAEAINICPDCEEDLEWYADLANDYNPEMYDAEWQELLKDGN